MSTPKAAVALSSRLEECFRLVAFLLDLSAEKQQFIWVEQFFPEPQLTSPAAFLIRRFNVSSP